MKELNQNQKQWIANEVARIEQISNYSQLSVTEILFNIHESFKIAYEVNDENLSFIVDKINSSVLKAEELSIEISKLKEELESTKNKAKIEIETKEKQFLVDNQSFEVHKKAKEEEVKLLLNRISELEEENQKFRQAIKELSTIKDIPASQEEKKTKKDKQNKEL